MLIQKMINLYFTYSAQLIISSFSEDPNSFQFQRLGIRTEAGALLKSWRWAFNLKYNSPSR